MYALSHWAISSVPSNCKFLICLHNEREMGPERCVCSYEHLLYKPEDGTSDSSAQIIQYINAYNSSFKGCDEFF